ncbi:MAG: endonuclease/exonuclease/phosphatase family protein [Jatrophihabitans sp.]
MPSPAAGLRPSVSRALVTLAAAACLLVALATPASATTLAVPTGVHVSTVSGTAFTVTANRVTSASGYRLYASTTKSDVYAVNLSKPRTTRKVASASRPAVSIHGLKYSTAVWYYRFEAVNGAKVRFGNILSVSLRPSAPTNVRVVNATTGMYLTWSSVPITGYSIVAGTDAALRHNQHVYPIRGSNTQFTPYGLTTGRKFYFRVQAINTNRVSPYSAEVSATVAPRQQGLRVMTYNVLTDVADGTKVNGTVVAPWATQRQAGVIKLIGQGNPDVISIQEGGGWVGPVQGYGGKRQVDTLTAALGSSWSLAYTETPPTQHGYQRTGQYIIYNDHTYRAVGAGGHWFIGTPAAAYQVLQNKVTGAKFLFVAAHILVGAGLPYDKVRETETRSLLSQATAYASTAGHLPIVYAGDFNSYLSPTHQYDGPGRAMRAAHVADALQAATALVNRDYNSANQYLRTPPRGYNSIDHVFASPGVGVRTWKLLINLTKGRLVGVIPSDHNPIVSDLTIPY